MRELSSLADKSLLKTIWKKRLRTQLRRMRLGEFELCHDPLEYAALDWELDATTENLSAGVASGAYRASAAEVVRAAKTVGLTRPLANLQPRDLLIFISLVQLIENQLMSDSYDWVRFGRSQRPDDDSAPEPESGWFRAWLKRQGQIWTITSTYEWLVESDIANFFGSVSVDAVCEHVLNHGNADQELVGLLRHMLVSFAPIVRYRASRVGGLPQENFDGSRVLAHTFLYPVDKEFEREGLQGRYSRWVDDIVIGANTWPEALQLVRRLQGSLEALDLYPNTAKTRIIRKSQFVVDYMKAENDYIGIVTRQVEKHNQIKNSAHFRERVRTHARVRERKKAWERVLRRYYSLSRRVGDDALLSWWPKHLEEAPGSAAHIFEYLATFRLTKTRFDSLTRTLKRFGGTYEDVERLAHEYLLIAPNVDDRLLRREITSWGWRALRANMHSNPHLAASSVLLIAKFGGRNVPALLKRLLGQELHADTPCRQQIAIVLFALQRLTTNELVELVHDAGPNTAQHIRFLRAVSHGEAAAFNLALGVVQPVKREYPDRHVIRPRGLMLVPLLAATNPRRFSTIRTSWVRQLRGNGPRMTDAAALRWLTGNPF